MTGRLLLAAIILSWFGLVGCGKQSEQAAPAGAAAAPRRAAITLQLLVIGDPELAKAARLLRGEWAERSGGKLVVSELAASEFTAGDLPEADVVIFPSQRFAELVVENRLRPVRASVLENSDFAFDDVLPVVRNEVMRFGNEVFAISLGEAPLMLAITENVKDSDRFDSLEENIENWQQLAKLEPHASARPAAELIARAASFVDPSLRSELLFDPQNMQPRLSGPHFRRALEQMARWQVEAEISGSYKIVPPTAESFDEKQPWRLSPLPVARETYDSIRENWEPTDSASPLAVLGFSGRLAGVTTSTRNATSAFKLLAWLTSGSAATRLSSSSPGTTLFRNSQRHQAEKWLGRSRRESVPMILELLSGREPYLLARIPEIEQYLDVLDESVQRARQGSQPNQAILESAADEWEELTDRLGRDRQLRCYRMHLGLDK